MGPENHEETLFHQMEDDDNLDTNTVVGHGVTMSAQVGELFGALSKAQGMIKNPSRNAENPFFKSSYTDLTGVWNAARGPLSENGLSVTQLPSGDGWDIRLTTILAHRSGQWIMSTFSLKTAKPDAHGAGSALTYLRRYSLASVVGIAPAGEDDDGNASIQQDPPVQQQVVREWNGKAKPGRKSNVDVLRDRLTGLGVTDRDAANKCVSYATEGRVATIDDAKSTPAEARKVLLAINAKASAAGGEFLERALGRIADVETEEVIDVNDA
tara:strand:+ start:5637 stop:6443 length:807 start_codon:yes stop_codon:yes gene_type:complete